MHTEVCKIKATPGNEAHRDRLFKKQLVQTYDGSPQYQQ